jgi:predicted Abi (CAAX) family protease
MSWLGRWGRTSGPSNDELRALEDWVRLRFQLAPSDPMVAIIGAVARLTEAGMGLTDATDTVLRILQEEVADGSAPG